MSYSYDDNNENLDYLFYNNLDFEKKSAYKGDNEFLFKPLEYVEPEEQINKTTKIDNSESKKTAVKNSNSKIKSIHKDHRKRVRDKFFKFGLSCFSEIEVLEFILFHSIPMKDTNETAHRLLDHFGSLENVLNAEYYDLLEVNGISEVSAGLITLHRQISKYISTTNREGEVLNTAYKAGKFCCGYFANHLEENSIIIILDENQTAIAIEIISEGSETETGFYPRKIIKLIIKHHATKIILSHNHPNKNPHPSNNDIHNTAVLAEILKSVGIELVDHIVCGGDRYISMADRGFLKH